MLLGERLGSLCRLRRAVSIDNPHHTGRQAAPPGVFEYLNVVVHGTTGSSSALSFSAGLAGSAPARFKASFAS